MARTLRTTQEKPLVVKSPGCCIYCGDTNGLTREHVIPRALRGGLIIRESSCGKCAAETKKFEQICLRENFGVHRLKEGYPSYHKKERRTHLSVRIQNRPAIVTVEEHPRFLILPVFDELPRIATNLPHTVDEHGRRPVKLQIYWEQERSPSSDVSLDYRFEINSFYRFLGKIAHGTAFAHLGPGAFRPLLVDLILGRVPVSHQSFLIGRWPDRQFGFIENSDVSVMLYNSRVADKRYVTARVQLFTNMFDQRTLTGTPYYWVVVGETIKDMSDLLPDQQAT